MIFLRINTIGFLCSFLMLIGFLSCENGQNSTADEALIDHQVISNDSSEAQSIDPVVEIDSNAVSLDEAGQFDWSYCETAFNVYISDPIGDSTHIRASPNGAIIMKLPNGEDDIFSVDVVAAHDGWFKLNPIISGMLEDIEIPDGVGWIHHSIVRGDTRNYAAQTIPIYAEADDQSEVTGTINTEARSLWPEHGCGKWVFVTYRTNENGKSTGWIDAEWICGSGLTNCN